MGILKNSIAILICLIPLGIEARPISYSGGSTLMFRSDSVRDALYYHYSPTYKYSVGIEAVNDKFLNQKYLYFKYNYLLGRRNTETSQSNLYFRSGISSNGIGNVFYGIHGDWETRRLYAGAGYRVNDIKTGNFTEQYVQLGVAPYVGNYGDLHTWLIVKAKKSTTNNDWDVYPVLKLFKGSMLMELGYSKKSAWDIHLIYRF